MAERISTRFTSAVSMRERYSTLFTREILTLDTVSMGHGNAHPRPGWRTPLNLPNRWTTPRSEALIWKVPEASHSSRTTAAITQPRLPVDPASSLPLGGDPPDPPNRPSSQRCQPFRASSRPPDLAAGRFFPQGDSPRFPGSFQAIVRILAHAAALRVTVAPGMRSSAASSSAGRSTVRSNASSLLRSSRTTPAA